MTADPSETDDLIRRAAAGDPASWQALLRMYRTRLRRMVGFRLDPRLQGRVDASDVVQDICLEAFRNLDGRVRRPDMPFFLWLRGRVQHADRLGDVRWEVSLYRGAPPEATSAALAARRLGHPGPAHTFMTIW